MNMKKVADKLGVVPNTVRNWIDEYHQFLSSSAHPPKGRTRVLTAQDVRILHYIAAARDIGQPLETITAKLQAMQDDNWQDLPAVPHDWSDPEETIPVTIAANKAYDVAQIAVLQRDLDHAQQALQLAESRVEQLERDNAALQASQTASEAEKHDLQIKLTAARGEVETVKARLQSYAITGGDRPIPVALIIAVTAAAVLIALVIMLVIVRLVL